MMALTMFRGNGDGSDYGKDNGNGINYGKGNGINVYGRVMVIV